MAKFRKAVVAAGAAFVTGLVAGFADGTITWPEVGAALGLGLAAGAAVYRVANTPV